jgi:hypothetical protein
VQIALLPLDERPVNTRLPADVAAIAGGRVLLPPASILPSMRRPGDTSALREWLHQTALDPRTDAELARVLAELDPTAAVHGLSRPWQRTFDVDFEVTVG